MHGREVKIQQLTETQMLLIGREAKILQSPDVDTSRKLDGIDRMFMILETAVVEAEDRKYMENLMMTGELGINELINFVTVFGEGADETPKVRRGSRPVRR